MTSNDVRHECKESPTRTSCLQRTPACASSKPDLRAELDDVEIPAMFENLEPQEQKLQEYLARKLVGQLFCQVRCLDGKVDGQGHHLVERPWHHQQALQQAPGLGAIP
ncbi:hypothetical protein MRX96_006056 [Rhipicephalus microplus]